LTYIPITDFHRFSFEHKFKEIMHILMCLGAKQITARRIKGWGSEAATSLATSVPQIKAVVGGEEGEREHSGDEILFRVVLEGSKEARLPDDLVWYHHEPMWQIAVEGSSHGMKDFFLFLRYHDDYGINSGLKVLAERAGFELSSGFASYKATTWRIEVGF